MNSRTAQVKTSLESHVAHNNERVGEGKGKRENYKRKLFLEFGLKIMSFFIVREVQDQSLERSKGEREKGTGKLKW